MTPPISTVKIACFRQLIDLIVICVAILYRVKGGKKNIVLDQGGEELQLTCSLLSIFLTRLSELFWFSEEKEDY